MAEKDKPVRGFGRDVPPGNERARPDVLRIKDIIPGAPGAGANEGANQVDIPRFDLAQDIMVEQRRLTAIRRKGPDGIAPVSSIQPQISTDLPSLLDTRYSQSNIEHRVSRIADWDPIIADIVAKDIERLCSGARI
jgi:hypothetical protein